MNRTRHIQFDLPPLSLEAAIACIEVLECVIDTIWCTHGDVIDLWRDAIHRDAPPGPTPPIAAAPSDDDDDLPF